jgi:heme oxygenase
MPKGQPPTLHGRLRADTRHLHDHLESAVDIEKVILSRVTYAAYLQRLHRVHAAAEAVLCAIDFAPFGFDYAHHRRSRAVEDDLKALGNAASSVDAVPAFAVPPSLDHALGAVYVVEGSALGARAILPQIKSSLGLDEAHGASFFIGFGTEGKAVWRAVLAAIDDIPADSARADAVVAGAIAMFNFFTDHLPSEAVTATRQA